MQASRKFRGRLVAELGACELILGAALGEITFAAAQIFEKGFAVDGLDASALNVIVAAVERSAQFGHFSEIDSHRVFDEVVGGTTALGGQFVQARFGLRFEMHFHGDSVRSRGQSVKMIGWKAFAGHSLMCVGYF